MSGTVKKVLIGGILLAILLFGGVFLSIIMQVDKPADYEKYNLADDISDEVEDNGDVYLVRRNKAASLIFIFSYVRYSHGEYDYANKKNMKEAVGFGVELAVNRAVDTMNCVSVSKPNKTFLFNTEEYPKIKEVFYYSEQTGKEYPIWSK